MSTEKVKSACSECRRSKLKCDRNFPCQQCIKRGCSGICPFGVLPATKGNKTLMAQTHKLEEQVKALSARNRHLESALAHTLTLAHSSAWPEISCHTALVADDERSGLEAIAKDLQTLLQPEEMTSDDKLVELPYELLELMHAFPYGLKGHSYSKLLFIPFIPSFERANELFRLHKNLNSSDSLVNEGFEATFGSIYHARKYVNIDTLHPHALAVFFMLMAHGSLLVDDTEEASRYVALARAAISLAPIAQEASVDTVHALIMMNELYLPSHGIETESRWMLIGITVKITQRIGLYRDTTSWNMSEDEQQRRRTLFWEVYCSDLWASIVMGRPPAMSIQHTDCRFPDEHTDTRSIKTGMARPVSDYHKWKFHFFAECLSVVSQHCFNIRQPSFSSALETDRMIRAFPTPFLPPVSDDETELSWSSDPREAIQQALGACFRESSFLHLHKAFFAPVIVDQSLEPLEHKYCFSVLAVYRSSVRLVLYVQGVYFRYPECSQRSWPLWANVYRACLTFALTVIKRPDGKLAPDALLELTKAVALFAEGSKKCRPSHYMSIMEHLLERAQSVANSVSLQSTYLAPKLVNSATGTPSPGTEIFPMNMNHNTASDHVVGPEATHAGNFWPTNPANAISPSAYFDENQYLPSDQTQSQFYKQAPPAYLTSPQTMTLESLLGPELSNPYSYDMTASNGNFMSLFNGLPG